MPCSLVIAFAVLVLLLLPADAQPPHLRGCPNAPGVSHGARVGSRSGSAWLPGVCAPEGPGWQVERRALAPGVK